MTRLIPFNRKNTNLTNATGFNDFYNMLDDFFNDSFMSSPSRNLLRDTFKIDIEERENEYLIEAELPGIKKEEIDLNIEDDNLCISVNRNRTEETNSDDKGEKNGKNYIHRERRSTSMSRRVRLANAKFDEITAKLDNGVLAVSIPKDVKASTSRKIDIE